MLNIFNGFSCGKCKTSSSFYIVAVEPSFGSAFEHIQEVSVNIQLMNCSFQGRFLSAISDSTNLLPNSVSSIFCLGVSTKSSNSAALVMLIKCPNSLWISILISWLTIKTVVGFISAQDRISSTSARKVSAVSASTCEKGSSIQRISGSNPCFNGINIQTTGIRWAESSNRGFNPCFNGINIQTRNTNIVHGVRICFNPCFNGINIQTFRNNTER